MMYLVSATPGTGKTCWVVKQLLEWIELPENKNRKIYANIAGLKIEGIEVPPEDFRECPDGSIIIYDEAQEIEHYSSDSRANNPIAKALSKHRHRGFDIWFISQDPSLLHKYVLKNIYLHYYLWRPAQRQNIEIFTFARAIVTPTKEDFKNAYDVRWWRFDEYYLQFYQSTVLNTSKKVGSSKKNGIIITFIIFVLMIAYFVYPVFTVSDKMKEVEKTNKTTVQEVKKTDINSNSSINTVQQNKNTNTENDLNIQNVQYNNQQKSELDLEIERIEKEIKLEQLKKQYQDMKKQQNQVQGLIKNNKSCRVLMNNEIIELSEKECVQYMKKQIITPVPASPVVPVSPVPTQAKAEIIIKHEIATEDELVISFADGSSEQQEDVLTSDFTVLQPKFITEFELEPLERELDTTTLDSYRIVGAEQSPNGI